MKTAQSQTDHIVADAHRHHLAGRLAEAEAGYLDALRLQPKHADALHHLGVLRHQQNDPGSAVKLISRAIKTRPGSVDMYLNLGAAYRKLGEAPQAVFAYRKALALEPHLAAAQFQYAHALREARDYDAAIAAYQVYLKDRPENAGGHLGLGHALAGAGRHDDAMTALDLAITFDPDLAEGYNSIASLLLERGQYHLALPFNEKAVERAPDVPEWRFELALNLLRFERFAEAWPHFETRCTKELNRIVRWPEPPAYWRGENLEGKNILVWMEQGLGDQMLFASLLPEIISRAHSCVIECGPRLAPVFARSFPTAKVVGNETLDHAVTPAAGFDYQIAAGSLGQYLRRDAASFPRHSGYLHADQSKTDALRARYKALAQGKRIVGLSWRTQSALSNTAKSADLLGLAPILHTNGVMFVNLQYGDCRSDLAKVKKHLGVDIFQDPSIDTFADIDGLFAQVAAMDLVITTSNTTAHIAGSQNVPVWILLPAANGLLWYWFLRREDSPWYPSARLIRASHSNANEAWWTSAATVTAADLRNWLDARR